MKTFRLTFIMTALAFLASSCYWHHPHTIIGSGPLETTEIPVSGFTGVAVTGECNVTISTGPVQKVEVSAQSEVLEVMTFEVKSGVLNIGYRNGYNVHPQKEVSAAIVITELDYIGITGAGNFLVNGDPQPMLSVYITGSGDVDASGLEVEDCYISITGAGNCEVNATRSLEVDISGVGNVYYLGNPDVDYHVSGVGKVAPLGG